MGSIAHNPTLFFGIGIPLCAIVAIFIALAFRGMLDKHDREKEQHEQAVTGTVRTGRINLNTGEVSRDEDYEEEGQDEDDRRK